MTPKILSQLAPPALTETELYQVPSGAKAQLSEIVVCNRSGSQASFRISISQLGAATAAYDYIYYDTPLAGNDTLAAELDLSLDSRDTIRVYASSSDLSFSLFGART